MSEGLYAVIIYDQNREVVETHYFDTLVEGHEFINTEASYNIPGGKIVLELRGNKLEEREL